MKAKQANIRLGRGKGGKPEFPSLKEALEVVPKIHGHVCTASYLGTRMGLLAMKNLELKRKRDLCVGIEILTCAADGIAAATQCSYGSGRMVFLDYGKFAAVFANKETKEAVRIACRERIDREHISYGAKLAKFYQTLSQKTMEKALKEREKLKREEDELLEKWGRMSDKELFIVQRIEVEPNELQAPLDQQYITSPVKCHVCGEIAEKAKMRKVKGKLVCRGCAG